MLHGETQNDGLPSAAATPRGDKVPLSFGQQRMWLLDRMLTQRSSYNVSYALQLRGELDVEALQSALDALIARHEVLRTRIALVDGEPLQHIAARGALPLEVVRVADQAEARDRLRSAADAPFDLERGPLMRAQLLVLAAQEHWLMLAMHHIVCDGWSMAVLWRELASCYAAARAGSAPSLPGLPMQYADYALWQRERMQGSRLETQLDYWRGALAGLSVLELPGDRERPAVASQRGARVSFELDAQLTAQLKALGRAHGATLFMTLLAAFQVLLSRYSGQSDVAVGVPIAGRNRAEFEGLLGFFVNTLVLRADLSENPRFVDVLAQVRARALDAYAHQELPFEKLVEVLAPKRDLSRNPLFQVSFAFQNMPRQEPRLEGLEVSVLASESSRAKFDLDLGISEHDRTLRGSFTYALDLFDESSIQRLAAHWQVLLEAIVAGARQRVHALPLCTSAEREQLTRWNATRVSHPSHTLAELFEAQVARTPQAIALHEAGQRIDYAQLNERANALAHHLRDLGVGPEVVVGVCLERSVELVVALLAILKAGGAYLPLDAGYPAARLALMLEDAAAPLLVTQSSLLNQLGGYRGRLLCVDRLHDELERQPRSNPAPTATPRNLAYVIYTSGSTGKPKGVMIEHAAICNHMQWMQRRFPLDANDRVLQKTPISADASVWEFFAPLNNGARLVLAPPGAHRSPGEVVQAITTHAVTILQVVPGVLGVLLDHPDFARCTTLRRVFCGGEALSGALARKLRERTGAELVNLYGPTEAAIDATYEVWDGSGDALTVPIGAPIDNMRACVLDDYQRELPVGLPGELYLGGAGLARGYVHRPDETARQFFHLSADDAPAGIFYRTGDRVRRLADGRLQFLGRVDSQIKIRGVRIEPAELEASLIAHPGIAKTAVACRPDARGEPRLIAYVVAPPRERVDTAALNRYLRAQLPAHFVPDVIVELPDLPVTPNGKVDYARLPSPSSDPTTHAEVPPRDPIEEQLAEVWADILGHSQIGARSDFFALGGHSLRAMQLVARIHGVFGVDLPVQILFATPTLADIAAEIATMLHGETQNDGLPSAAATPRGDKVPLSFGQQRMWLLDRMLTQRSSYNVSYALQLRGELDVEALQSALDALIARHEVLRTRIALVDGEPLQHIAARGALPLEVVRVADQAEARDRLRSAADAPFDLERGPLMRAQLLVLAAQEHWLMLAMHHIVCDGWSMAVLWRELASCYAAARAGSAPSLPGLPMQYADYALWQRERMQGSRLETQLDYWRGALAGLSVLELPGDRERPAVASQRGARVSFELDAQLTAQLKALGRAHGATLFMTLLAAFQVLLSRYSGQSDVAVGVPIAGRNRAEFEGLLGFFVNTLVLRADLSENPRFVDVLAQVRARALDAYAHQELPFEKLVEVLAPKRDLSRNPLFQVSFAFQNMPRQEPRLEGLEVSALASESSRAKFDLDLGISEHDRTLRGSFTYALDLFDESSIQRLAAHWQALLEAIATDAQQRIGALSLCTEAERAQLTRWNATRVSHPSHTLAELFEAQVARTPQAIALHEAGQRIDYAQLNERANALAHHLRDLGVGPEVVVGVCMERSVDLAVALLGILKAGGAYLPLDPDHPEARLAFMLEDAAAPLLLTHTSLRNRFHGYAGRRVCIDELRAQLARKPQSNPVSTVTPRNLAYVIYTSGSTGKPKGVMIEQRSIANYLQWFARTFDITSADAVLQKTPIGFDASLEEWLVPLVTGARLVIADTRGALLDVIVGAVQRESITVLQVVPSLLDALLDHPAFRSCTSLRLLVCGAEALSPQLAQRAASQLSAELVNLYGPTETTISSTFWRCDRETLHARAIPIGRPIANTLLKVVDSTGQMAPLGARGELCIGGVGVARGYLNRDELTQALFVRDPVDGERYYRTGDRVRWRGDGVLEFLGRADAQVKIRGFRVEPEETASALAQHRAIMRCHLLARMQPTGDLGLTAYVVQRRDDSETAATLRTFLATRLPEPMVPVSFVFLDALPVNANGKIDVAALPPPAPEHVVARPRIAPRDRIEETLCALWSEVLRRQEISIDDDFFECGGHSLLAARLFARIHEELGLSLPLGVLFEAPTVRQLADRCRVADPGNFASLVSVSRGTYLPPLFSVPGAFGNVLGFADIARALGSDQPFYGLQSAGLHDDRRPVTSIEAMAANYLAEIRRQHPRGPYALLGACFGATVAFEMAQQLLRAGERVAFLGLLDPAYMGGHDGWTAPVPVLPASVHRARTVVSFVLGRLRLYARDLSNARAGERLHYLTGKMRNVRNVLTQPVPLASARREIAAISVYQANAKALERYRPRSLAGVVRRVVVFHTERGSAAQARRRVDWNGLCGGDTLTVHVSGKDSGDMIRGANAQLLADQLRAQLALAFASATPVAAASDDVASDRVLVQER